VEVGGAGDGVTLSGPVEGWRPTGGQDLRPCRREGARGGWQTDGWSVQSSGICLKFLLGNPLEICWPRTVEHTGWSHSFMYEYQVHMDNCDLLITVRHTVVPTLFRHDFERSQWEMPFLGGLPVPNPLTDFFKLHNKQDFDGHWSHTSRSFCLSFQWNIVDIF